MNEVGHIARTGGKKEGRGKHKVKDEKFAKSVESPVSLSTTSVKGIVVYEVVYIYAIS